MYLKHRKKIYRIKAAEHMDTYQEPKVSPETWILTIATVLQRAKEKMRIMLEKELG